MSTEGVPTSRKLQRPLAGERPRSANPDSLLGRTLAGLYRVDSLLGEGGIGRVYRAEHLTLRRSVALKVLLDEFQRVPNIKQRFEREAMTLARLAHPNLVSILDFRSIGEQTFLVMELVDGCELTDLIDQGPMPPARAFALTEQILRGLAYAHGEGVIHRDLKPANVLVRELPDDSDHVTMLDFGLAKTVDGSGPAAELTRTGLILGTPAYMAPEQGSGAKADPRTDVYAAGLLLYEMLAGRRPFEAEDPAELIRAHLVEPPPPIASVQPAISVSAELDAFVSKALSKSPSDRFADAEQMRRAFAQLPAHAAATRDAGGAKEARVRRSSSPTVSAGVADTEVARSREAPRGERRRRFGWWAGIGAAAICLAAGWWFYGAGRSIGMEFEGGATSLEAPPPAATKAPARTAGPAAQGSSPTGVDRPDRRPASAAAEVASRPDARNPWGRRTPRILERVRHRTRRGGVPSARQLKALQRYRADNPGDPRGLLLLGHVYAARGWLSNAVETYVRVFNTHPSLRGDPQMMRNLLRIVANKTAHTSAVDATVRIYGAEARSRAQQELGRLNDPDEQARLQRLLERISPEEG